MALEKQHRVSLEISYWALQFSHMTDIYMSYTSRNIPTLIDI
jgi:hypothetical protein